MNIYIDESGSFVSAQRREAWNVVVAYALPETEIRPLRDAVRALKLTSDHGSAPEVKLRDVEEKAYFSFLAAIGRLNGVVFCTATDAGLNRNQAVTNHRDAQEAKITEHVDKIIYETGREGVLYLAGQVAALSPQLYVQLYCQIDLMFNVVGRAILYFIERQPNALRHFRWRIDRKNAAKNNFQDAFEKLCPAILQTRSLQSPLAVVEGFDYRCLSEYFFAPGEAPTYLRDVYGLEVNGQESLNIQKLVRGDLKFVNSEDDAGVQAADLIAAGLRRCLRSGFAENDKASTLLGRLMVQAQHNGPPITLVSYSDEEHVLGEAAARSVKIFIESCRLMIRRS